MMRAVLVVAVVALDACASRSVQPASVMSAVTHEQPARTFDKEAPPRVETPSFALELAAPSSARVEESTPVSVTIEGRGDFHVNLEYPLRIELGASEGVGLEETTFGAEDASELSEARARVETRARWSGTGRHWLAARVQFAVCTPETCVPREESLAIFIDVP